ncbi:N-acetyl-gamma-glutamyl-phosphate reductase [Paludicola sp. MB14-C6]|uniref:N-acetyl-gamma-glutamyl-phosphate reductase n=1 Tax=Paludihabitans sp. MB14-C6 TaxID=3070656 RepID=UPI0027DB7927|nr:N-acetyl-gamma-glutamyl-phosphate reductase [Paludicola sp. MB14-C6]WMJ22181.1 N-acetyl-gamma-glutamyl-phosphate reductase [Paludicola sp. MB14-C6]
MSYKIFIDGQEGTTGLKIIERFQGRTDVELLKIDEALRKDISGRKKLINQSDFTFLCLPDDAAIEAVSLVENNHTKIIDASTAHRTNPNWVYGLPELSKQQREKIKNANRVAVPGCYASGFISIVSPLVAHNVIVNDYPITCHAVSGYSGAGKKAIAVYEGENKPNEYNSPRQYALGQQHKHLKEMQAITGLTFPPMFNPIVDNYFSGMVVSVPLLSRLMSKKYSAKQVHEVIANHYQEEHFVKVMPFMGEGVLQDGFLAANTLADTNMMQIFVCGNEEQVLVAARLDNLGKGASGAAVQCMNIMMGIDETTGLE